MSNSKTRPEKRILSFLVSSFKLQNNIMKVCIAEKPSVAKEIADIVGAKNRHDGYYEGLSGDLDFRPSLHIKRAS